MAQHSSTPQRVYIKNRKARFNFELVQEYNAGIVLLGTEIKSIRTGRASLNEAYCFFSRGELFIKQMHIAPYDFGNIHNHEETRVRKLLLARKELNKLQKSKEKGFTIIPLSLYITKRGYAKLHISLAKGKKSYDKRHAIKEREMKRDLQRSQKVR